MNITTTTVICFVIPEDVELLEEFEKTNDLKVWKKETLSWAVFYKKIDSTCFGKGKYNE